MSTERNSPIRVFLIDDHPIINWGLERLIEHSDCGMEVVGSATNSAAALQALDDATPDVILLDLALGGESGLDAIPRLLARCSAKILVLTGVRDEALHAKAVLAGARGVLGKEASAETMLMAIRDVYEGQVWLDRATVGSILVEYSRQNAEKPDSEQQKIAELTDREREIVVVTVTDAGATARAIAAKLHISEHTLRNHFTSIYSKLGVANRLELFAYVHKYGLIQPEVN